EVALPVSVPARIDPPDWLIVPAEARASPLLALTSPARVRPPVLVVSASVLAAPVSLTGPFTSSASLSVSARPAVVANAPSVPTRLVAWPRLAEVALPVSVPALIDPPDWLIVPAEARASPLLALTSPARVRPPVLVVSASVLAAPVSLTGPFTSSASLSVSARPAVVANAPSVPTRLVACPRLAEVALPVSVPARTDPPDWLIVPAEARASPLVALTSPARVRPPVLVVSASVLAAPVSLTGPFTSSASSSVSARPAVVVNAPSVPTRLVACPRLAEVALPVSVPARTDPPDWLIVPAEARASPLVALTSPARVRPPVLVVSASVLAAPVSL